MRKIDAFGHYVKEDILEAAQVLDTHLIPEFSVALNTDTGVAVVVETGKIDLNEVIEANRDNCGMAYVARQIAAGVPAEKFADDGKHSGMDIYAHDLNTAYQQSLQARAAGDQVAAQLGITDYMSAEDISKLVTDRVNEILAQQQAQTAAEEGK